MSDRRPMADHARASGRRRRRIRRRVLFILLVVMPVAALGVAFYLLRREPAYWKQHEAFLAQTPPEKITAINDEVSARIEELASAIAGADGSSAAEAGGRATAGAGGTGAAGKAKLDEVRMDETRKLFLNEEELRALVAARLDEWAESRGYVMPKEIKSPGVAIDDGRLVMAFKFESSQFSQVLSGLFDVAIMEDGMALLTMEQFVVGSLPVPVRMIGSYLSKNAPEESDRMAKIGRWLAKLERLEFKPVLEMEHRRRARVTDFMISDEGLALTLRVQDRLTYREQNERAKGKPEAVAAVETK